VAIDERSLSTTWARQHIDGDFVAMMRASGMNPDP